VIAFRAGDKITELEAWRKWDLMETAGRVTSGIHKHFATAAKIDVIGYGAGVYDRLKEQGEPVVEIDVSRAPRDQEHFADMSTELWWILRERLDPNPANNPHPIGLPPDEELMGQLSSRQYKYTSRGQIKIEPKDEMRKRGLPSPDRADAVALAFAPAMHVCNIVLPDLSRESVWRS
jgi:hypothetical protein